MRRKNSLNTSRILFYYAIKSVTPNNNFNYENHLPKCFALHYNLNISDRSTLISIYNHKSITKLRDFPMKNLKRIFHIFLFIVSRWKKNGKCLTGCCTWRKKFSLALTEILHLCEWVKIVCRAQKLSVLWRKKKKSTRHALLCHVECARCV